MEYTSPLASSEWLKAEQGPPCSDKSILLSHLEARGNLINLEKQRRSDNKFRQTLSHTARESCKIVDRIRDEEKKRTWNPHDAEALGQHSKVVIHPGMIFSQAKKRMETTTLWQIVKRMPKGALLHAHMDAMVDLEFLFDVLLSTPGVNLYCATAITNSMELETAPIKFKFVKPSNSTVNESSSIWTNEYIPKTPIPVLEAANSYPDGGRSGFLKWLRGRCSITEQESLAYYDGVDDIWRKFSSVFRILNTIFFYEPIFRLSIRRILSRLHADGVRWVDMRLAFTSRFYREGNENPEPDFRFLFETFEKELSNFQASEEGRGFWGSRIIWTTIRSLETPEIIEDMKACIAMKIAYPKMISGYDLVGQEDAGRTLKSLLPELLWFKKQCAQKRIKLPFFFHAGECLGDGSETDQNLFDAILLGTRRIGHGFSLYKHPLLIELVKEKNILVESCPISNEVLRLCSSIDSHPLPALIACGVSCSLSNDDPTILGQDSVGLTHDFWQAIQGWDNLGLAGLASLAENSVRWAAYEDFDEVGSLDDSQDYSLDTTVRINRLKQWRDEWEEFCLWVVDEFGDS